MDAKNAAIDRNFRVPACSIAENAGVVSIRLEMPGVPREGLEVRIEGNELAVRGSPAVSRPEGAYLLKERRDHPYRKLFTIDETIARDKVEAGLANGVLTLTLRVKEAAKPRRIELS